jgi:phosphoenolpyruvate phosphomutase
METATRAARLRTRLSEPEVIRVSGAHDALSALVATIAGAGVAEALCRSNRYVDAGADAILMHSKRSGPALRAAVRSMRDALGQVLVAGSSTPIEPQIAPMADIFRLQRVDQWLALES